MRGLQYNNTIENNKTGKDNGKIVRNGRVVERQKRTINRVKYYYYFFLILQYMKENEHFFMVVQNILFISFLLYVEII